MITLFDLPQCILAQIYSFDATYREIYTKAISELVVHRTWWASTGNCKEEFRMKQGVLHGMHTLYHDNGSLLRQTMYQEGKRHGVRREYSWRKNGDLVSVCHFQDGKIQGPYMSYFTSEPDRLFCEASYLGGKKHGRFRTYHKNGGVREEWMYVNGRRMDVIMSTPTNRRPRRWPRCLSPP